MSLGKLTDVARGIKDVAAFLKLVKALKMNAFSLEERAAVLLATPFLEKRISLLGDGTVAQATGLFRRKANLPAMKLEDRDLGGAPAPCELCRRARPRGRPPKKTWSGS